MENAATPAPQAPIRRAALIFIFFTVLIDILAFGLIIPVLPHLIESFLGGDVSRAAIWYGFFSTAFFAMQFLFTPVQGALSDWIGRRPVILRASEPRPWPRFPADVDGQYAAAAVHRSHHFRHHGREFLDRESRTSPMSPPPQKRAQAFGMLGMAFGIGFVVAPAIGGFLGEINLRPAVLRRGRTVSAEFRLRLVRAARNRFRKEKRTAHFELVAMPTARRAAALLRRYPQVLGLVGVLFLMALAHMVYPTTFVLFTPTTVSAGARRWSDTRPRARGHSRRGRAGRLDQEDRGLARRTPRAAVRSRLRHRGFHALWIRADRLVVLGGDAGRRDMGRGQTRGAGDHDPSGLSA